MGFWSSFFGTSAAHAYRDAQKEKKDVQRWNDLDYELMMYAESFNEYLERVGISCGYIYDVECVNNGNILPEKRKIDNMRKKVEEYISLGGFGRLVDDIEEIDRYLEKIKYLRSVGQINRQEEFAQYNLQEVKEIVGRKQCQNENVQSIQKTYSVSDTTRKKRDDINYTGTHTVTNVQMWDYDTNKFYPCDIKVVYSEKKLEIHQDDYRIKKLLLSVPISENDYMNTEVCEYDDASNRKMVVTLDDTCTFVMSTNDALKFKAFYDKFDDDKDEYFCNKQDEICDELEQISNIEVLATNSVKSLDESKILLNHDAFIVMQRAWAYNKCRSVKFYDEDSIKNAKNVLWKKMNEVETLIRNMSVIIMEDNMSEDNVINVNNMPYICWEAIKIAAIKYYSTKWEERYGKYIDSQLKESVSEEIDGTLDNYIKDIIRCNEINNDDMEMIAIFAYHMIDKGYTSGYKYFPAYYDIMIKAFEVLGNEVKNEIIKEQLKGVVKHQEKSVSIDDVDLMNGNEFEHFVCELYQKMGYSAEVTKQSGDQGLDVIAEKNGKRIGIQAKCYSGTVGNSAVQEAVAGKSFYHCDKVVVVTNNYFTQSAKELAHSNDVILWDRDILKDKIKENM